MGSRQADSPFARKRVRSFALVWTPLPDQIWRASAQSARMRRRIYLAQLVHGHQRVDLCRAHRCVSEQFLNHPHIGASIEQMSGKGMAEGMRRYIGETGARGRHAECAPGALPGQTAASGVEKYRRARLP
jgi:hypothetical protein